MSKRLLNYDASDYLSAKPMELKQAILASEGRTIMAENVPNFSPFYEGVTTAELERGAGADLILFNSMNLFDPVVAGVPSELETSQHIPWIKKAIGRAIGINLEPIDLNASMNVERSDISNGSQLSEETLAIAEKLGFDFICLTGNPASGVSNKSILKSVELAKNNFNGLVIAGKMHGAGVDEPVMNLDIAKEFIKSKIDILLVPAPYTVPHFQPKDLREIANYIKRHNKDKSIEEKVLLLTANGTSQDSSDIETIKKIALESKAAGADVQHIGDSYSGYALPQNIFAMGQAIRGYRHQVVLMSRSNHR